MEYALSCSRSRCWWWRRRAGGGAPRVGRRRRRVGAGGLSTQDQAVLAKEDHQVVVPAQNRVIRCRQVPCYGTGSHDLIYERKGNGTRDRIYLRGGETRCAPRALPPRQGRHPEQRGLRSDLRKRRRHPRQDLRREGQQRVLRGRQVRSGWGLLACESSLEKPRTPAREQNPLRGFDARV